MILYIVAVNDDHKRSSIINLTKMCKKKGIDVKISDTSLLPVEETVNIDVANVVVVFFSENSIYSTWLLGIVELLPEKLKLFYMKLDGVGLPKLFDYYKASFKEVKSLDEIISCGV